MLSILAAFIFKCSWFQWRKHHTHGLSLPPGPRGLPIIGIDLDMPLQDVWDTARQWGKEYGNLVYVRNLGTGLLFLNSYEAVIELFEKRGYYYSRRPRTTIVDLEGWPEWLMSLMPYGDDLRKSRQCFNNFFQKSVISDHHEVQMQSAHLFGEPPTAGSMLLHSLKTANVSSRIPPT
ncbi:hypothetical protein ACEPAF_2796 [Sanghuangporus sanghuang]